MPDPSPAVDPVALDAYFALIEVSSLLRHTIEQQLRQAGDLSSVQFHLLATLGDQPDGSARMTDLADGVVYSRSGLTYQAGLLEQAGLVTRAPSVDDERGVTVTITAAGREVLGRVFPGHIDVLHRMLLDPLTPDDVATLGRVLGTVRAHLRAEPPRSAAPRRARQRPASSGE